MAMAMKMKPTWSKRRAVPFSWSPSAASTQVKATRPSGRMRKKVQRQLSRSVTRPPKVGPMIGPITPPTPHIMMMKGCWLRWNEDSRMVWPIGKIGAPNAPCTTRNASSPSSESTRPHSTEVSVKPVTEQAIRVRQPSLAASQPVSGVAMAVATRLKVRTQEICSWVAESAPLSCGRITVTLVAVRPNRMVVNCTDSRISHCRPERDPIRRCYDRNCGEQAACGWMKRRSAVRYAAVPNCLRVKEPASP